ncbi:ATPase [Leptospira fletcheri]|uniref:ATPase n=1 Tax=Leptospira fletcheri TaxID=2484981 RepID=A0A4R9GE89_9LEPT|nr:SRPBCC family protein [Leptospira fletcheri]TGK10081.1 ATPase [Leptospira fletcheri]
MDPLKIAHESFSIEKIYKAAPNSVFSAWGSLSSKSKWFIGPKDWVQVKRELDFRVGGNEVLQGRFGDRLKTVYTARFHSILPDQRIVFVYDMHLNDAIHSVSLASVEIEGLSGGRTRLTFTEQVAFLDGTPGNEGNVSRKNGTEAHLDRLALFLGEEE